MIAAREEAVPAEETTTVVTDAKLILLDDAQLVELTRQGSNEAYATLYDRYVYAARRLARHLGQREESEDVVADAFAQIFDLLQRGKGPDRAFRAYLFTTIRHESGRRAKASKRVMPTDDDTQIDTAVPFGGGQLDGFEKTAIRAAYESLPDRWQTVLWHLDVEGRKPQEIAEAMGLRANSVSALVYRARSGLREAYLQQHLGSEESASSTCQAVRGQLAGVLRRTATKRDQEKVHAHLETCDECIAVYLDLQEVNREVGLILVPAAVAGAVGGGAALATIGSGGAMFAKILAGAKGLFAVLAAPAAAAAVTTAAVVSIASPTPQAAEPAPTVVRTTPTPAKVAAPVVGAQEQAPATKATGSTPSAQKKSPAAAAPSASTPAPSAAAPSAAAPTAGDPAPVKIAADADGLKVSAGSVEVSTKPVKDLVDGVTSAAGLPSLTGGK